MRNYILPAAAAAVLAMAGTAMAANVGANFSSKIKIVAGCNISAGDINFPDTTIIAGTETANSTVTVRCTKTTAYSLSLSNVTDPLLATTTYSGSMSKLLESITYKIAFTTTPTGVGSGADQTYTMKGTVDAQNTPSPGNYSDSRTVYVVF